MRNHPSCIQEQLRSRRLGVAAIILAAGLSWLSFQEPQTASNSWDTVHVTTLTSAH